MATTTAPPKPTAPAPQSAVADTEVNLSDRFVYAAGKFTEMTTPGSPFMNLRKERAELTARLAKEQANLTDYQRLAQLAEEDIIKTKKAIAEKQAAENQLVKGLDPALVAIILRQATQQGGGGDKV